MRHPEPLSKAARNAIRWCWTRRHKPSRRPGDMSPRDRIRETIRQHRAGILCPCGEARNHGHVDFGGWT